MGANAARLFVRYAIARRTAKRALKVALVVGPVLTLINHAHTLIALEFSARFAVQTVLTFGVPYLVSTYSSAMAEVANARAVAGGGADG